MYFSDKIIFSFIKNEEIWPLGLLKFPKSSPAALKREDFWLKDPPNLLISSLIHLKPVISII